MKNLFFLNVYIPKDKNLEIGFSYIYGIGRIEAKRICRKLGLNSRMLIKDLNSQLLDELELYISFNYIYGFRLKRLKKQNIEKLVKLRSYKGSRHFFGYLVRGQRSKNKKIRKHLV